MRPTARQEFIGRAQRLAAHLPRRWDRRLREFGKMAIPHHGQRFSPARGLEYVVLRRRSRFLVVPFGPGQLVVDTRDEEIGRTVFLTGGYERWHMETALQVLAGHGRRVDGTVFVDVGANIGTSTVDALLTGGFVSAVCFEPDPHNVRLLTANAALNGLSDRVEVHPVALSDMDGAALLQRSSTNLGDHRVVSSAEAAANGHAERRTAEKVQCRRLDGLVEEGLLCPQSVGLFWSDAQGHELKILRGATTLAAAGVPHVIEFCPDLLKEDAPELEDHVASRFSHIVDLRTGSPVSATALPDLRRKYQRRSYTDLLLIP